MKAEFRLFRLDALTKEDSPITYGVVKPGDSGDVVFIRGGDLVSGRILESQLRTITQEVSSQYKRTLLQGGELLICLVGQPGQVAVVPHSLAGANIARQVGLIRLRDDIDANFVSYYLRSPDGENSIGVHTGGSVQQVINLGELRSVKIPIPHLTEQKRIVAILDQAFEGIAIARANTEKNLQNARALFESYLQSVFTRCGEGWFEGSLEGVVDEKCSLSYGIVQPGDEFENGLPIIRPTDLTSKFINLDGLKRINPDLAQPYSRTTLIGDELLLCVRGSTGVISIATEALAGANVTRGIVPIRFKNNLISASFGYFLLTSAYVQEQIKSKTYGAALMQINIGDLRKIKVRYPSLKVQDELALKLNKLDNETQRLEALYQRKIAFLDELKKSLLQQAFAGEL
jgi:type I restriction enzyme, S subunit